MQQALHQGGETLLKTLRGTGCRPEQLFPLPALKVSLDHRTGERWFLKGTVGLATVQMGRGNDGLLRTLDDIASFSVALRMTHNAKPETEEQVDKELGSLYIPPMDLLDSRDSGPTCP